MAIANPETRRLRFVRALLVGLFAVIAAACGGLVEPAAGEVRTYFIAADEVAWDYAPRGRNLISGRRFGAQEKTFVARGPKRIGRVYRKVLYREYTDATFKLRKPRAPQWRHLGMLGPLIRAEVGDTIRVVFRNNGNRRFSMHPHGVFYEKHSEGSPYSDGTSGSNKADDAVRPGRTHIYEWQVPERAGPGPADGDSVMWMYHSHVDEPRDTNTGLIGNIIINRDGTSRSDGTPLDVDREFVAMFAVIDENASWLLGKNIRRYADRPRTVDREDEGFEESNLMHSINGYVYGNQPMMSMRLGERVRWYTMGMGTEVDLHTPHWHGNTLLHAGMRTDVLDLLPASMHIGDMQPDAAGTWLFHCHVNDHITAGMLTRYHVDG